MFLARKVRIPSSWNRGLAAAWSRNVTGAPAVSAATNAHAVERADVVVIGGGVVGLAIAREMALAGRSVLLVEARHECDMGSKTGSRKSDIIHCGATYKHSSLKAQLAGSGREQLYQFCREQGVQHSRCGKLFVATSEAQIAHLESLRAKGEALGIADLQLIGESAAKALEPGLAGSAVRGALLSPASGIVDVAGLRAALWREAAAHGATASYAHFVVGGEATAGGIRLELAANPTPPPAAAAPPVAAGAQDHPAGGHSIIPAAPVAATSAAAAPPVAAAVPISGPGGAVPGSALPSPLSPTRVIHAAVVINAAGLAAQAIASAIKSVDGLGRPDYAIPPLYISRGIYFMAPLSRTGDAPFTRLIYPLPDADRLVVNTAPDLNGALWFGFRVPKKDVEWVTNPEVVAEALGPDGGEPWVDQETWERKRFLFIGAIRSYYPDLPDGALMPGYVAMRPKSAGPGAGPDGDFVISGPEAHGVPGLLHLFGIETPGLSACLAIASATRRRLQPKQKIRLAW